MYKNIQPSVYKQFSLVYKGGNRIAYNDLVEKMCPYAKF